MCRCAASVYYTRKATLQVLQGAESEIAARLVHQLQPGEYSLVSAVRAVGFISLFGRLYSGWKGILFAELRAACFVRKGFGFCCRGEFLRFYFSVFCISN